ncbi:sarcosine dehydrogenase, mitochondrial-like isoform X2 [Palaemon carinicauda]|uniref:sarcosine dehydrogenase, mitochondrial-like isoform X2 n=1 Tax=Palaemon carinicauda TaxID=392227 RepID=UPI0035B581AE
MKRICKHVKNIKAGARILERPLSTVLPRKDRGTTEWPLVREYGSSTELKLPTEADVVVIGGGIMGCFTLYHLARLGCSPILLERHKLTSGTTWHTNGLVWRIRPREIDTLLLNATRDMILDLENEEPSGWTTNGGLFIASNQQRMEEYARLFTVGRATGVECHLLTPREVEDSWPLLNVGDITGALYSPGDGTIDPSTLCAALTKKARAMGAQVYEGVDAQELQTRDGTLGVKVVKGVHTSHGSISTKAVVNCTGVWCDDIVQQLSGPGSRLPQVCMEHCIVIMEPLPGVRQMPNVRDHDANMCLRVQGDSLIIGGYELNAPTAKVDRSFTFGLYDFKMDNFLEIMEGAINRVPKLADVGIKAQICGPESFTPDRKPLLGEDWDVRGLFHGFGFNSSGIMLSGGCSEQLAHWVLNGRPQLDMADFDCRRFPKQSLKWHKWAEERSHESYTSNYSIVFPDNQPLAGRAMITDPLHQRLTEAGCFWEESLCWERPGFFTSSPLILQPYDWKGAFEMTSHDIYPYRDVLKQCHTFDLPPYYNQIRSEYEAMKTTSAIINRTSSGKMGLTGKDAEKAVAWLFLEDIEKKGGNISNSLVLNKNAGVEANVIVFSQDESTRLPCESSFEYTIQCDSGFGPYVRRLLRDMCLDKGLHVTFETLTSELACLLLVGPLSLRVLESARITGGNIPVNTHCLCKLDDTVFRVCRYGPETWELHVPVEDLVSLYEVLITEGTPIGLRNAGYRAFNVLQLERGIPSWQKDMRANDSPLEAGIWSPEDLKSDRDFLGKIALMQQAANGITKSRLILEAPNQPLRGNEGIVRDGHLVGIIRRADMSFHKEAPIAVGYASHPLLLAGVAQKEMQEVDWEIESQGKRYPAKLYHP